MAVQVKSSWLVVPLAGSLLDGRGFKLVHHRCGYPLYSSALMRFEGWLEESGTADTGIDSVVVQYRSAVPDLFPLVVFCCPGCDAVLPLWWEVERVAGQNGVCVMCQGEKEPDDVVLCGACRAFLARL